MNVFHGHRMPDGPFELWASLVDSDGVELTERVALGACSYDRSRGRIVVGGERRSEAVGPLCRGKTVVIAGCALWRQATGGVPWIQDPGAMPRVTMDSVSAEFGGDGGLRFAIKEADEDAAVDHSTTAEKESA